MNVAESFILIEESIHFEVLSAISAVITLFYKTNKKSNYKQSKIEINQSFVQKRRQCFQNMSRSSRDLDVGDIRAEESTNDKNVIELIIQGLTKSSPWKSLAAGTATGWLSGLAIARAGRGAAAGLGGGILLLQAAQLGGYVAIRWERVRAAAARVTVVIDRLLDFVKDNSCYSAGFAAGVCFGFACA